MKVFVHLYTQSEPCYFENVRNAYSSPLYAGGIDYATIGLRTGE